MDKNVMKKLNRQALFITMLHTIIVLNLAVDMLFIPK